MSIVGLLPRSWNWFAKGPVGLGQERGPRAIPKPVVRHAYLLEISNSPHINMFSGMLEDLARAHELIVTARALANRLALLKLHATRHTVVGKHCGAGSLAKAYGCPVRIGRSWNFLQDDRCSGFPELFSFSMIERLSNALGLIHRGRLHLNTGDMLRVFARRVASV